MKKVVIFLVAILPIVGEAQESTDGVIRDIDSKVDKVLKNQEEIKSMVDTNPLGLRKYGIEFNFFRLLAINEDSLTLSGGLSYFDHKNKVEWAFPSYIGIETNAFDQKTYVATLDVAYRKFLGESVNGFYISGFSRLAYIKGPRSTLFDYWITNKPTEFDSDTKVAVGVGIGYRIFSKGNFYWGTSLSAGRYLIGENNKYYDAGIDDSEYVIDVELLKFGYIF